MADTICLQRRERLTPASKWEALVDGPATSSAVVVLTIRSCVWASSSHSIVNNKYIVKIRKDEALALQAPVGVFLPVSRLSPFRLST